jgi:outer membrane protein assembly factor BamA
MNRAVLLLATLFLHLAAQAQTHVLRIEADTTLPRWATGPFKASNQVLAAGEAEQVRQTLIEQGYLEASFDSCATQGDTTTCHLHAGERYLWARLSHGAVIPELTSAVHFRERVFEGRPLRPSQLAKLFEDLLDECENHGYPFATVGLDSIVPGGEGIEAVLQLDRGRLVRIDSLVVKGSARISERYLWSHLGIRPGDPYNEQLVVNVDRRIRELPFITARQPAHVLFAPEQTKLYLFIDGRRASSINGILGVQPDPETRKVRVTGDLDLRLRNALRRGEAIDLNWRSLADKTQDLKLRLNLPFLFNTPFGTDLSLKLFKRDTTFLELNARAALEYLLQRGDKVVGFVNSKSSDRLGRTTTALPGLADVAILSYGLGAARERFDYRYNPREGMAGNVEGSVGRKRSSTAVIGTGDIPVLQSVQYELTGQVIGHLPVGRRGTIRLAGQGGWMVNDQLYTNELYRVGGLRTMRGVDEASIFCSSYAVGTVEYRYLFEQNSNLLLFVDQGWWEDQSQDELVTDAPLGVGVGTSFETKAGIFGLTYALARQFNAPFALSSGKVHFGFTSLF